MGIPFRSARGACWYVGVPTHVMEIVTDPVALLFCDERDDSLRYNCPHGGSGRLRHSPAQAREAKSEARSEPLFPYQYLQRKSGFSRAP